MFNELNLHQSKLQKKVIDQLKKIEISKMHTLIN